MRLHGQPVFEPPYADYFAWRGSSRQRREAAVAAERRAGAAARLPG